MKAGSLRDDELGALRESASSPSSGEVCLEVCSEHCFSLPSSVFYHICVELCTLRFVLCDGPVAQLESERDSAKVEVTRSNRVRSSSFMWAVAQLEEHCTVTAVVAGSSPVSPPKQSSKYNVQKTNIGTVAER